MSTLRELVAHDLASGDMSHSGSEETGLDRIGALSRADPLGGALWRVTATLDPADFLDARRQLVARMAPHCHPAPQVLVDIAQIVLEEWMSNQCPVCEGRRYLTVEKRRTKCSACDGTGRGHPDNEARARRLKLAPESYKSVASYFTVALSLITAAEERVERQVSWQLGHRGQLKKK
jgi:hypothetical protein